MKKVLAFILMTAMLVMALAGCNGKPANTPDGGDVETAGPTTNFPTRTINVICPWSPGGGTDTILRSLCRAAEKELGQTITVTNTTGGGGATGFGAILQAEPDGYNIGMITFELNSLPPQGLVPFDYTDFDPLTMVNYDEAAISVPVDAPYDTLEEFLDYAKAHPGELSVGNAGPGSVWHIAAGLVEQTCGVQFKHVPFDGAAPAVVALAGGHIDAVSVSVPEVRGQVESGAVKILAVIGNERSPLYPDVPTFAEEGYDISFGAWRGIAAPKGLPEDVREILVNAFTKAQEDPEFIAQAESLGLGLAYLNSEDFVVFLADNYASVEATMKSIGLVS